MATIGLCMIVKNETAIIRRCLESVRGLVDFALIVDTGSTDGTQELVRAYFRESGLAGEVVDEPWRDFAYNRTFALAKLRERAEVTYALIMDADDFVVCDEGFDTAAFKAGLTLDLYDVPIRHGSITHHRPHLCRNSMDFRYRGVLHEFLEGPAEMSRGTASGFHIEARSEGARSLDPDKYRKDAAALERALEGESDAFLRSRYTFYLAQSYRDCGETAKALEHYRARAEMGFWQEEVFCALYQAAQMAEALGRAETEVIDAYARATAAAPWRAEALHRASRFCRFKERHAEGLALAQQGLAVGKPGSGLFIEDWVYDYGLLDEVSVSGYWAGRYQEALEASERLLREGRAPEGEMARFAANAEFARTKLRPVVAEAVHLPVVCVFGARDIELFSSTEERPTETRALTCHCYETDDDLEAILIARRPHVIVTFGAMERFARLMVAPFDVRRRWLHFPDASDLATVGRDAFLCYLAVCVDKRAEVPLVSVFTPVYRTGARFLRPLQSMKAQTYTNWEWVIWDDSDDEGATAAMIAEHAARDHRIRLIRPERHSGVIGEVKYNACTLSRGDILVELDHDDELVPGGLEMIVAAHKKYPEAGFYYTDYAEVDSALNPLTYADGWGFGLGAYRTETFRGRELAVAITPGISPKVIRHLVAAPNHIRAWRRDVYFAIGGHNREIHVADDFELMIRTFLATRMVHIPRLGYVQYQDGGNTQRVRNKDIQRHVRYLQGKYDQRIHDRFVELGVDDYMWNDAGWADFSRPNPEMVAVASIEAEI